MCLSWGSNRGPQRSLSFARVFLSKSSQNQKLIFFYPFIDIMIKLSFKLVKYKYIYWKQKLISSKIAQWSHVHRKANKSDITRAQRLNPWAIPRLCDSSVYLIYIRLAYVCNKENTSFEFHTPRIALYSGSRVWTHTSGLFKLGCHRAIKS